MPCQESVVSQPPSHHSDIAPHLLYVKTAQRAIWLWVMEGGLNSPSEILEPVGKPQLFKCRKSWFYKMLIWSALGTSEQNGSEKEPPPPSIQWRQGAKERRGGLWQKEGEKKKRGEMWWGDGESVEKTNFYFVHLKQSVSASTCW